MHPTTPALWPVRHPWLIVVVAALAPVLGIGLGQGIAQANGFDERTTYLSMAVGITISALAGFLTVLRAKPSLATFGFRVPANLPRTLWLIPAALVPVIVFATSGYRTETGLVAGFLWIAIATAFSEEIWYRAVLIRVLSVRGQRFAVIVASALFGVLHLANLFGGKSPLYATLQVVFATLFGFVAAEIFVITRSLWPTIIWHAVYDFIAYLGGDSLDTRALIAIGVSIAILVAYAIWLWRQLPH